MTEPSYDRGLREQRWAQVLRESADKVSARPPDAHLLAVAGDLPPGLAPLGAGVAAGGTLLLSRAGSRASPMTPVGRPGQHRRT